MKCPNPDCDGRVIQKSADGATRFRIEGPLEVVDGICKARCYWCRGAVELPLQLVPEVHAAEPFQKMKRSPIIERVLVRVKP